MCSCGDCCSLSCYRKCCTGLSSCTCLSCLSCKYKSCYGKCKYLFINCAINVTVNPSEISIPLRSLLKKKTLMFFISLFRLPLWIVPPQAFASSSLAFPFPLSLAFLLQMRLLQLLLHLTTKDSHTAATRPKLNTLN